MMTQETSLATEERLSYFGLDGGVRQRLGAMQSDLGKLLPPIAESFYDHVRKWPALASLLGDDTNITRLKKAQQSHWAMLFSGRFDDEYVRHAVAVGEAHERIGLEPRWYIGAYCFILERLIDALIKRKAKPEETSALIGALLRASFLDMDLAVSTYIKRGEVGKLRTELLVISEALEREVEETVGMIAAQADQMNESASELTSISRILHEASSSVGDAAKTASQNVCHVADASETMRAACGDIAREAESALGLTDAAVGSAEKASGMVHGLAEATSQINEVVDLVQAVAAQTRLLALNATIEAARAGEAGKGFAVVASEVKSLARQTESAINTISGQAERIRGATAETAQMVGDIVTNIRSLHSVAERVTGATNGQRQATEDISGASAQAAAHTRTVAEEADALFAEAQRTGTAADRVQRLSNQVSGNIHDLRHRMTTILRASGVGDRRREKREPVAIPYQAVFAGETIEGYTGDLTCNGSLLICKSTNVTSGCDGSIHFDGVGKVAAKLIAATPIGLHTQFTAVGGPESAALARVIAERKAANAAYVQIATDMAKRISALLEKAVRVHRINLDSLFDSRYARIDGTEPQQYRASFTDLADELLPAVIEEPLRADSRVVFCAAVDRNGYLPTHNRCYSQPQRPGDPAWNTQHCRNRRIFDDRTGLLAARNTDPCLQQTYPRDMGDGKLIVLQEFDAPIYVNGRHWGGLRLATKP